MPSPVIVLAFANPTRDPLPSLNDEADHIQKTLQGVEGESQVQTVYFPRFSLERIADTVQNKNWALSIFHYAGHVDGQNLQLTDTSLAFGSLGRIFADRLKTQIVFLNGCGTMQLVAPLLGAGIPVIIATKSRIADTKAAVFSRHFYDSLAAGQCLLEAFELASDMVKAQFPDQEMDFQVRTPGRNLSLGSREEDMNQWDLIVAPGREEMLKWRLFDHRRRRKRVWWMRFAAAGVCILSLLWMAAWGFLLEKKVLILSIQNHAFTIPNYPFPEGFQLMVEKSGKANSFPINDWNAHYSITYWKWETPEFKVYIQKGGTAYSNPDATINLKVSRRDTVFVTPIFGGFTLSDSNLFNDSLLIYTSYENHLYRDSFWVKSPNYRHEGLLKYQFQQRKGSYLRFSPSDPTITILGPGIYFPSKPGFPVDEEGFRFLLYPKGSISTTRL